MRILKYILPVFLFAVAFSAMAQGDFVFRKGQTGHFGVERRLNSGVENSYRWEVFADAACSHVAGDSQIRIIGSSTQNQIELRFEQAGEYCLVLTESNKGGCINANRAIVRVEGDGQAPDGPNIPEKPDVPQPEPAEQAPLLALRDINLGWKNQPVSGCVLTNDCYPKNGDIHLRVTAQPAPAAGRLTAFDTRTGAYRFEPADGYTGEAVFEYELAVEGTTPQPDWSKAAAVIRILDPSEKTSQVVALDNYFAAPAGQPQQGNFMAGDLAFGDNPIVLDKVSDSSLQGTLRTSADGTFGFTPASGYSGRTSFGYKLADQGNLFWGTVDLYCLSGDQARIRVLAADAGYWNTSVLNGHLPENGYQGNPSALTYALVGDAESGQANVTRDGAFSYRPTPGKTGYFADRFIYSVSDGQQTHTATVYVINQLKPIDLLVQSSFRTGACAPVRLDASRSSGSGKLVFSWSPAEGLDHSDSPAPLFVPGDSRSYTVTLSDELGNSVSKQVDVQVDPQPEVVTERQVYVNQTNQAVMLDATASIGRGLKFDWSSGTSGVIVSGANSATPSVKGIGTYYLTITDEYGCMASDSVDVGIWIQANADQATVRKNSFGLVNVLNNDLPKGSLNPASLTVIEMPKNGTAEVEADSTIRYTPNPEFTGADHFVYRICNFSSACDQAEVQVDVVDDGLFIPNGFSPNADGINDFFEIKGLENFPKARLKVFSRWGVLVYDRSGYGQQSGSSGFWNGVANVGARVGHGRVPAGTYFYVLELGGGKGSYNGYVYIAY